MGGKLPFRVQQTSMRHFSIALLMCVVPMSGCATPSPLMVQTTSDDVDCNLLVGGKPSSGRKLDKAALQELAKNHNHRAVLDAYRTTPYKCIGGVVFILQNAGFQRVIVRIDGVELADR
jgi:hypothetical protein